MNISFMAATSLMLSHCAAIMPGGAHQAQSAPSLREADGYTISFRYDPLVMPMVVVPIRVNGAPVWVYLETGAADAVVLDRGVAKRLRLGATGKPYVGPNGPHSVTPTRVRRLEFFGTEADDVPAAFSDLEVARQTSGGVRVGGFMGLAVLKLFTVRLDFARHRMTLFYKPHTPYSPPHSASVRLTVEGGRYFVPVSAGAGADAKLALDTGSDSTDMPEVMAARLHPLAHTQAVLAGVKGMHLLRRVLLPRLYIGAYEARSVPVNLVPAGVPAHFGLDLLSRYRATLDFRNRRLTLEHADRAAPSVQLGDAGVALAYANGHYVVSSLTAGSPAAVAGVRAGDVIVSVDDRTISDLQEENATRVVDGYANSRATLVLRRHGQEVRISFRRRSEFASAPSG